jgi:preprotein translocase subunit SecG
MITFVRFLLGFMLVFTALFLILLVLVQRGRGGGLAGALGGMGGQSAFGAKAGDTFTRITIGVAAFWIILCIVAVNVLGRQQSKFSGDMGGSATVPIDAPEDGAAGVEEGSGEVEAGGEAPPQPSAETPAAESSTEGE